jgi:hypothetical protein
MFTRQRVRNWLAVLGYIALFLAVMPYFRGQGGITPTPAQAEHLRANPGDTPYTEDYVFGWTESPLVKYHSETTLTDDNGRVTVGRSRSTTIGWVSWSSLTLAVGVGLLGAARLLRPEPGAPGDGPAGNGGTKAARPGN